MRERVCKNCGGRKYVSVGQNMLKCQFCGTLYVDEQSSREEEFLIAKVSELLREQDFSSALEQIDKLLQLFPDSYEAYFLKSLAKAKIVLYPNQNGTKSPRFFGEMSEISEDADFLRACELAPTERRAEFEKTAKRISKFSASFALLQDEYDCFVCLSGESERAKQAVEMLKEEGVSVFLCPEKAKEEELFYALKKCKVLLLVVAEEKKLSNFSNVIDRWKFFMNQNQKPRTSVIMALADGMHLPPYCQNVISLDGSTFFQDVGVRVKNEIEKFPTEVARIESVKIEHVSPERKAYANFTPVKASPVGRYVVENVTPDGEAKKKWVFLCLKNGDFATAEAVCEEQLQSEPNSSDLLFARLLISKKIKTREDFFSDISNFDKGEDIERILNSASREYAENFVDEWEKLVEKLNDVDVYLQFLTYLASFESPEREHFISSAENLAVETENEALIAAVETCFNPQDVDRYINFYYALAQRHDEQKWFDKVLSLDEGHFESNLISLLSNFKTTEDKLTFRSQEKVEAVLSRLSEEAREDAISAIVNIVLQVAYCNLKAAQEQIDFYLSYLPENKLPRLCEKIAQFFLHQRFYAVAEKYASIAVSQDKNNEKLYWLLVKIKMHCQSDNELVTSGAKIMTLPEWQTLLTISDGEYYSQIASKANLYEGTKIEPKVELLDKATLTEKLNDFLLRNREILLEAEKENVIGTQYFLSQLTPFEDAKAKVEQVDSFEDFQSLSDNIFKRLELLDLTLDMSINISTMQNRAYGLKKVYDSEVKTQTLKQQSEEKKKSSENHKKFFVRFFTIFLEYVPLAFTFMLGLIACISPKSVFMFFSDEFLLFSTVYALCVVVFNFVLRIFNRRKKLKKWNHSLLILLGLSDFVLFFVAVFVAPVAIDVSSAKELQTIMQNAKYSDIVLTSDIDYNGKTWSGGSYHGKLDGDGHTISNLVLSSSFITRNDGEILNLTLEVSCEGTFSTFGTLVGKNYGTISNCSVSGQINVTATIFGGLVGENYATIENCFVDANIQLSGSDVTAGGLVGKDNSSEEISDSVASGTISISATSGTVGGLVGRLENSSCSLSESAFKGEISCTCEGELVLGGLVGSSKVGFENCYSNAIFTIEAGSGYFGGLVGKLENKDVVCSKSYCSFTLTSSGVEAGSLVGYLLGRFEYSYSISSLSDLYASRASYSAASNCTNLESGYYASSCNFNTSIWNISSDSLPKFVWEG